MGFLDDALGAVKGAVLEGAEGSAQGILHNALGNSSLGGLEGLVGQLQGAGLGSMVSSWTSGQGMPISVDQLKGALTPEHISQIASALHMPEDSALAHLAEHLPMLVGGQPPA
jgi:uncharacterized protein YidB (DUF937 family)